MASFLHTFMCWCELFSFHAVGWEWVEGTKCLNRQENCYAFCILYFVGHCREPFDAVCVIVWKQLKMIFISLAFEWVVYGQINNCKCEQVNLQKVWNKKRNAFLSFFLCLSCASMRAIIKLACEIVLVKQQQDRRKTEQKKQHNYSSTLI